jgi:hypothetical protein
VERVEGKEYFGCGGKGKKIARTRVHPVPQICTFVELRVVDTCFKILIYQVVFRYFYVFIVG